MLKLGFTRVLLAFVVMIGFAAPLHADSSSALFVGSDNGTNGTVLANAAVHINLVFNNQDHTAQLSTATGFQYNSAYNVGLCPSSSTSSDCYFNQGWWSVTGGTVYDEWPNSNYIVGQFASATFRDFFSFDTRDLNNEDVASGIKSAQFVITLFSTSGSGSVQFVLSQTTLPSATFNDTVGSNHTTNATVYGDLANGLLNPSTMLFGSQNVNLSGPLGSQLTIALNTKAIDQIKAAYNNPGTDDAKVFTMGGALVDAPSTVPEPGSLMLLASGAVGVFLRRRKR